MLIPDQPLIRKHSYTMQCLTLTPLRLQTLGFMPRGGARGQNLGISQNFFFSVMESFIFEQQVHVLFRVDFLYGFRP